MDGNAFLTSLQQLGQYLNQQQAANQGGGSFNLASGSPATTPQDVANQPFNLASGTNPTGTPSGGSPGNIAKVVTQVHYNQPETGQNMGQPAVTTAPPPPQVQPYNPPGGAAQPVAQPNAVTVGDYAQGRPQAGGGQTQNLGQYQGPGSGYPTSNAISGITSALSKGLTDAASSIAGVKTMPSPINMGAIPGINQVAPTLIGRRVQQPGMGYGY